jgi:Xaa-Pro aminopeptidase
MSDLELLVRCFSFDDSGDPGQFGYDALSNLSEELQQFAEGQGELDKMGSTEQNYLLLMARRMMVAADVAFRLGRARSEVPYTKGDPMIALLRASGELAVAAALEAERKAPGAVDRTEAQWLAEVERYRALFADEESLKARC